eukprot:CAMPEP_0184487348 /NCGR_PEP_ID=MMETSP0113_2-20130426/9841_1 /TAXON_ID=91329 /ORGANISM="Norrisiella sphaerica, Strain BC52" /LENGTH=158 /DNA_ID=CAMNT_0026869621 /DNA_START=229 /DNA_END=705 /DNA_ORIENTATION=+
MGGANTSNQPIWKKVAKRLGRIIVKGSLLTVGLSLARRNHLMRVNVGNFYEPLQRPLQTYLDAGDRIVDSGESVLNTVIGTEELVEFTGSDLLPSSPSRDHFVQDYDVWEPQAPRVKKALGKITDQVQGVVESMDQVAGDVLDGAVHGIQHALKELKA